MHVQRMGKAKRPGDIVKWSIATRWLNSKAWSTLTTCYSMKRTRVPSRDLEKRMELGEYPVRFSHFKGRTVCTLPYCTIFEVLTDAIVYAESEAASGADLLCAI